MTQMAPLVTWAHVESGCMHVTIGFERQPERRATSSYDLIKPGEQDKMLVEGIVVGVII